MLRKHGVFFLEGSETKKNWVDYEMNVDFSMDVEEFLDGAPFSITRSRRQKWSRKFDEMRMHGAMRTKMRMRIKSLRGHAEPRIGAHTSRSRSQRDCSHDFVVG